LLYKYVARKRQSKLEPALTAKILPGTKYIDMSRPSSSIVDQPNLPHAYRASKALDNRLTMVLFRAQCGCKFVSCGAIDSHGGPICGCKFKSCGPTSIARDEAELDKMDNEKFTKDMNEFLDTLTPGDLMVPEMPQGDPLEQLLGYQGGPREEEPRLHETIESIDVVEKEDGRHVEQLSADMRLR